MHGVPPCCLACQVTASVTRLRPRRAISAKRMLSTDSGLILAVLAAILYLGIFGSQSDSIVQLEAYVHILQLATPPPSSTRITAYLLRQPADTRLPRPLLSAMRPRSLIRAKIRL